MDEWGFVTEGLESNGQNNAQRIEQGFALSAYNSYLKSQSDLFTGLNNFLNQAMPHLYLHCSDGKASTDMSRMLIEAKMNEVGDGLAKPALISTISPTLSRLCRDSGANSAGFSVAGCPQTSLMTKTAGRERSSRRCYRY